MNNTEFFKLHKKIGAQSLDSRRKFIGMLPEAYRRKLHYRKPFDGSIYHYAAKLCGLSKEQVDRVLNLEERFQKVPKLHQLLVSGEVSHNKLARVASIATEDNEAELAEKVQALSKTAVEVMVKDFKIENGLNKPQNSPKFVPGHKLQARLDALAAKGHDVDQLLLELLDQREEEIEQEKQSMEIPRIESRYVPVKVRRLIEKEYGQICSAPNCFRKAEELHHTRRFALSKRHDPRFLAPMCSAHHELAHAIDERVHGKKQEALP